MGTVGSQYCAFNSSSTLLAASCDALRTVSVWSVASGALLWRFAGAASPVLPLRFAGEWTLVFSEAFATNIHIVELW